MTTERTSVSSADELVWKWTLQICTRHADEPEWFFLRHNDDHMNTAEAEIKYNKYCFLLLITPLLGSEGHLRIYFG